MSTPKIPISVSSVDHYTSLLKDKSQDENRPPEKGEFATRIARLSDVKKAELNKAIAIFKDLESELPDSKVTLKDDKATIKARTEAEVEKAAMSVLIALRRDEVGPSLIEKLTLQLYHACLFSGNFEKAVGLYPKLKIFVGGRLKGIYALKTGIRERVFKAELLEEYFLKTPNARDGLLQILSDPSMVSDTPNPRFQLPLFNLGSLLPMYYMLSSCSDLTGGLCGNCSGSTETRLRMMLSGGLDSIKPGMLNRLCEFASTFA